MDTPSLLWTVWISFEATIAGFGMGAMVHFLGRKNDTPGHRLIVMLSGLIMALTSAALGSVLIIGR